MPFGLKENSIEQMISVFKKYAELEQVILYGSRAKGNFKNGSDIDLTLVGEQLNLKLTNKIENELDDLMLPYTFDVSIYNYINNSNLLEHIKRVGKVFYRKNTGLKIV